MAINDVAKACTKLERAKKRAEELERLIKANKREIGRLRHTIIPHLMVEEGVQSIVLDDGRQVVINLENFVNVTDKKAFHRFLEARKEDHLIKMIMRFEKMSHERRQELLRHMMREEYDVDISEDVHHQTCRKYFQELLERNPALETEVSEFGKITQRWNTKVRNTG